MWNKIKEFFATKYRIVPVYQDNDKCGFIVHKKCFLCFWTVARITSLEIIKTEKEILTYNDAYFKTKDEAMNFITSQKTTL